MQQNAKKEKIYIFLVALFSSVVILSNLLIAKWVWIPFYPRGVPGGLLLYPLTFLISDLVLELYGKQSARFMVLVGFFMAVFSWVILGLLHVWPEGHNSSINLGFFFQFFWGRYFQLFSCLSCWTIL